jgi:hypothetical protein
LVKPLGKGERVGEITGATGDETGMETGDTGAILGVDTGVIGAAGIDNGVGTGDPVIGVARHGWTGKDARKTSIITLESAACIAAFKF